MTRINIASIRHWTEYPPHWVDAPVMPEDVAALLDVAEAVADLYICPLCTYPREEHRNGCPMLRFDFGSDR